MDKLKRLITHAVKLLQYYIDRVWYLPMLSLLAILDVFFIVIPTDGLTISSSMLKPRKWFYFGVFSAAGSVLGAMILCYIVQLYGIHIVETLFPNMQASNFWLQTQKFFDAYGLWLLFAVALSPLSQQPVLILAVLATVPLLQILLITVVGRFLKFLLFAYIGSHAPHLIKKLWGMKDELQEVGIE
ncbi:YqaA family protein [Pseudobdellovibrio sp. HCB154]|uniref:YqaA family protein n=1 Tax=Pseudobdellovibrio sp. HCB154 TaxID=3386277 RepID=UPI0039175EE5